MLLTELDRKESARERHPNIYRIGLYFQAARDVANTIAAGVSPEVAFADTFTPSRGMHSIARALGLKLNVDRGRWVLTNPRGLLRLSVASDSASSTAHHPRGRFRPPAPHGPIPAPPDYSTPDAVRARAWERGSLDTTAKTWTPIAKDPAAYIKSHHDFMRKVRDAMEQERGAYSDFQAALAKARARMARPGWGKDNPMRSRHRRNPAAPRGSDSLLPLLLLGGGAFLLLTGRLQIPGFAMAPRPAGAPASGNVTSGLLSAFMPALSESVSRVGTGVGEWLRGVLTPATGETAAGAPAISAVYMPEATGVPWWDIPAWGEPGVAVSTGDPAAGDEWGYW